MSLGKILKIVLVIAIFLAIKNYHAIIHLFTNGYDLSFSTPDAFHFRIATSSERGEVFEEYDADYSESEDIYYYKIPSKYLNNDDVEVYVSGYLWNCLAKPLVKVNGITQDDISLTNTGSDIGWSNKLYHFYYNDTILSNTEYKFYIRCHDYSDSSTVVFLPE